MRILNANGRLTLQRGENGIDVEIASAGQFGADVQSVYERWDEFCTWADTYTGEAGEPINPTTVGPPVPRPSQVFAIGVNYRDHAAEAGIDLPEQPMVFTKFPAAVTGPNAEIVLPSDSVDFEVELVAVIGREARNVAAADGWDYIAGLTAGQDLSDRAVQLSGSVPQQYNLGTVWPGEVAKASGGEVEIRDRDRDFEEFVREDVLRRRRIEATADQALMV